MVSCCESVRQLFEHVGWGGERVRGGQRGCALERPSLTSLPLHLRLHHCAATQETLLTLWLHDMSLLAGQSRKQPSPMITRNLQKSAVSARPLAARSAASAVSDFEDFTPVAPADAPSSQPSSPNCDLRPTGVWNKPSPHNTPKHTLPCPPLPSSVGCSCL